FFRSRHESVKSDAVRNPVSSCATLQSSDVPGIVTSNDLERSTHTPLTHQFPCVQQTFQIFYGIDSPNEDHAIANSALTRRRQRRCASRRWWRHHVRATGEVDAVPVCFRPLGGRSEMQCGCLEQIPALDESEICFLEAGPPM